MTDKTREKGSVLNLPEPSEGLRIVAMTIFKDNLYIATEEGVYRKEGDIFVKLEFEELRK